jgi:acetyl esterase/lipase
MKHGVWLVVLLVAASAAQAQRPQVRLPEGAKAHRDLEYVKGGHERQRLDLYVPEQADGPLPVIVWVHGGAWLGGSKEGGGPALPFVRRGYAVASINYRLSQHARFPGQIEDCKAAIRWLRANARSTTSTRTASEPGAARRAATSSRCWAHRAT